jgi:glucokinase
MLTSGVSRQQAETASVVAIDIGGTKMAIGLVDRTGHLGWAHMAPTPIGGAETVWAALEALLSAVPAGGHAACGIGCGGPMSAGGEQVSPLNIPGWRQFPLRARVAEATGLPCWVDNDAKALALADGWVGEAAGIPNYLSMVVSTGIGGGLVIDGRLLDGNEGNAGHVGHVVVEPEGRRCPCGGQGCLEAEASGTAIAAITGRSPAEAGPEVKARAGRLVGRAVATVANLLDLQLASVSGSVALGYGVPFFAAAQAELSRRARLEFSRDCRIVASRLGADGPLIGAAAVGWRGYEGGLPPSRIRLTG